MVILNYKHRPLEHSIFLRTNLRLLDLKRSGRWHKKCHKSAKRLRKQRLAHILGTLSFFIVPPTKISFFSFPGGAKGEGRVKVWAVKHFFTTKWCHELLPLSPFRRRRRRHESILIVSCHDMTWEQAENWKQRRKTLTQPKIRRDFSMAYSYE